jgi:hypothetical protein
MVSMKRRGLIIAGLAAFGLIVALFAFFSVRFMRERGLIYEIPGGYRGWIFVQFGDASCPPLQRRGVVRLVQVPPSGRICTSSGGPEGIGYVQFEYVYGDGRHVRLPASSTSGGDALVRMLTYDPKDKSEIDFVGNKDEFMHAGPPPYPWRTPGVSNK